MGLMILKVRGGYSIHDTDAPAPPAGAKVVKKKYATQELAEMALRRLRASGAESESDKEEVTVSEEEVRKRFGTFGPANDGKHYYMVKATGREKGFDTAEARDAALAKAVKAARAAEMKKLRAAKE
jgi:hypothetical protein